MNVSARRTQNVAYGIVAVAALLLPSCNYNVTTYNGKQLVPLGECSSEVDLGDVTSLRVETNVGDIAVVEGNGDKIRIAAKVKVDEKRVAELKEAVFDRDVRVQRDGEKLIVASAHRGEPDENDWGVSFTVTIPKVSTLNCDAGVGRISVEADCDDVHAHSGVGDMAFTGSFGHVSAKVGVGQIELDAGSLGSADLKSGTGDLRLTATDGPTGDAHLNTGVGTISCEVAAEYDGRVDLSTGVGAVTIANAPGVDKEKSVVGGSAAGSLGDGKQILRAKSGTGDVSFRREAK